MKAFRLKAWIVVVSCVLLVSALEIETEVESTRFLQGRKLFREMEQGLNQYYIFYSKQYQILKSNIL
jgi:hypothetical protein